MEGRLGGDAVAPGIELKVLHPDRGIGTERMMRQDEARQVVPAEHIVEAGERLEKDARGERGDRKGGRRHPDPGASRGHPGAPEDGYNGKGASRGPERDRAGCRRERARDGEELHGQPERVKQQDQVEEKRRRAEEGRDHRKRRPEDPSEHAAGQQEYGDCRDKKREPCDMEGRRNGEGGVAGRGGASGRQWVMPIQTGGVPIGILGVRRSSDCIHPVRQRVLRACAPSSRRWPCCCFLPRRCGRMTPG